MNYIRLEDQKHNKYSNNLRYDVEQDSSIINEFRKANYNRKS